MKIKSEYLAALNRCTNDMGNHMAGISHYLSYGLEVPKECYESAMKAKDCLHLLSADFHHLKELHARLEKVKGNEGA